MQDICKYFMYTRGRTGSTAIIDEINKHPQITCWQELFIAEADNPMMMEFYKKHGTNFDEYEIKSYWWPTYDLWKKQFKSYHLLGKSLYLDRIQPATETMMVRRYLEETENKEKARKMKAVGFKLLQNQADEIPHLFKILRKSNYKAIYLERVNIVRRVISGMVAKERKTYNALNFQHTNDAYALNLDEFQDLVKYELALVDMEKTMLEDMKFEVLTVTYEEFLEDRDGFYRKIFDYLGVDFLLPDPTGFSIMIPSVRDVVKNYEELRGRVISMGLEKML